MVIRGVLLRCGFVFFAGCVSFMAGGDEATDLFERRVRPVLIAECYSCHSAGSPALKGDLRLDSRDGMLRGGKSGAPAIQPGRPEDSPLLRAMRYADSALQMPPKGKLEESVVAAFEEWVRADAPFPGSPPPGPGVAAEHWAFQRPVEPAVPQVKQQDWVQTPVDAFVLAKLEAAGLSPASKASRRTLIRRLTFDLTGLPPAPDEVRTFEADPDPQAYEHLVERLLASPRYGERWGRHWLDVARYADTKGYVYGDREEGRFVHSYVYRDWVVRAMNEDMPYDQFIRLQLAADQLTSENDREDLAAMGFLTLGQRFLGVMHDIIDDRIDTTARGLLGLTVSCARCHEHKFDPIPTEDYYSLYGVFSNSSERLAALPAPAGREGSAEFARELEERQTALRIRFQERSDELAQRLRGQVQRYFGDIVRVRDLPTEEFYEIRGPDDLNPSITRRWYAYIASRGEQDSIFGPWNRFASFPTEQFAPSVSAYLAGAEGQQINPAVRQALESAAPEGMQGVAECYGALLQGIEEEWQKAKADGQSALADAGREALRAVLYGEESPVRVPKGAIVDLEWYFEEPVRVELSKLQAEIDRWIVGSADAPPFGVLLEDKPEIKRPQVFLRGNPANKGAEVPMQFLRVLAGENRTPFQHGSGRRELAEAIASRDNPLTARVMVNRVWAHHFGAGLVSTPSDFGLRCAPPSHPALLDWLACSFMDHGWSLKALHRAMVFSATYQQAGAYPDAPEKFAQAEQVDPANRLLWHFPRQRLDLESLRDAMLLASGELEEQSGGPSQSLFIAPYPHCRTIYGYVDRQFLPAVYRVFDYPNPDMHNPQRSGTTVPQQALYLMNNPFVRERAQALALASAGETASLDRLQLLYQRVYQHAPAEPECLKGLAFLMDAANAPAAAPASPAPAVWRYGIARYDDATGQAAEFRELPHFNGGAWQGGVSFPDGRLGYARLTAKGGNAGNDHAHAVVRRWVSPVTGTVRLEGSIKHASETGDGVVARVISGRHGLLGMWPLHHLEAEAAFSDLPVETGDTLDFLVDLRDDFGEDEFEWSPRIVLPGAEGAADTVWNAETDFAGPAESPGPVLDAWGKLAQVLLLSNEFQFVE